MPIPGSPEPSALVEISRFLKFLYSFAGLVYLPYLALLAGGTILSLSCKGLGARRRDPLALRLGDEAIRTALPNSWMVWLSVLAVGLNLEIGRRLYRPDMFPLPVWIGLLALLGLGLVLIAVYRTLLVNGRGRSHGTTLVGISGLVLLAGSCFALFCAASQMLMPERWPILAREPLRALSWTAVAKTLAFLNFGLALAGIVILFRIKGNGSHLEAPEYDDYLERTGRRVAQVFTLFFPLGLILDLVNLPPASLSGPLFLAYGGMIAVTGWLSWRLCAGWSDRKGPPRWRLLGGLMLVLLLAVTGDHLARDRMLTLQTLSEPEGWRSWPTAEAVAAPAEVPKTAAVDPGEEVFARICSICHAFDRRLVGPPLLEVLPAYREDAAGLGEFIRHPVRKNPEYPPMPDHGLKDEDIRAVSAFLLRRLAERGGG